jgi:hypothetical protein
LPKRAVFTWLFYKLPKLISFCQSFFTIFFLNAPFSHILATFNHIKNASPYGAGGLASRKPEKNKGYEKRI